MSRINKKAIESFDAVTHNGAPTKSDSTESQLRRAVMSCLLWEDNFYESGQAIADRIVELARKVSPQFLADLAVEARVRFNLRHIPLLLLTVLAETGRGRRDSLVKTTVAAVIQRADEPSELIAMWWKKGKRPIPAQFKKGISLAFQKFDAYQLAKYNGADRQIKMRDVMFLTHTKPATMEQGELYAKITNKERFPIKTGGGFPVSAYYGRFEKLEAPDTWEVALSSGADKKETFTRLLQENKLGYLAVLRNLRNMLGAGVARELIEAALLNRKGARKVFPFRFTAAARQVPQLEPVLDQALIASLEDMPQFDGMTVVLVDVSGSMQTPLSGKSDLNRMDAAATLAAIIPGRTRIFTFSNTIVEVKPRKGMAGVEQVVNSQAHGGTNLGHAITHLNSTVECDRLIVITDEQSTDRVPQPKARKAYVINVAGYQNSIAYGKWVKIEGFSESVIRFIQEYEEG